MSDRSKGEFTTTFSALRLQLRALFDSVGGEPILPLLDAMSTLGEKEKQLVIEVFSKVIERILNGDKRFITALDNDRKEMVDTIYNEIVNAMGEASGKVPVRQRLEVLSGGKNEKSAPKGVIDLQKVRRKKSPRPRPLH